MFITIAKERNHYEKGQVFPFLIAVMVVVIIMAMITVNLGQIGVFKTDVSNAADAGALAGASVLSGALLGFGLKSDMMYGEALIAALAIILNILSVIGIPAAIAIYIAIYVSQLVNYFQSLEEGKMAWSNAKKAALQYAFQNVGIDETKPSFREFIQNVYSSNPDDLSDAQIRNYYDIYTRGDDPAASDTIRYRIKDFSQAGLSRFMEKEGYWEWGDIKPGNLSPAYLTTGYGWNADGSNNGQSGADSDQHNYENYVDINVVGNIMYPLELDSPLEAIYDDIRQYIVSHLNIPWWLTWFACPACWVLGLVDFIWVLYPGGLKMEPIAEHTDNNLIMVTVKRFKRNENLGLWNFRYGEVQASASARAFRQAFDDIRVGDINVRSVLADVLDAIFGGQSWDDLFDTRKHLFETELTNVW